MNLGLQACENLLIFVDNLETTLSCVQTFNHVK